MPPDDTDDARPWSWRLAPPEADEEAVEADAGADDCVLELENEEDDELLLLLLELELADVDDADDIESPLANCDVGMAVFEPPDDATELANWQ